MQNFVLMGASNLYISLFIFYWLMLLCAERLKFKYFLAKVEAALP